MILDFTNCKSVEDVNKVLAENRKQVELVSSLPKRLMPKESKHKTADEIKMQRDAQMVSVPYWVADMIEEQKAK